MSSIGVKETAAMFFSQFCSSGGRPRIEKCARLAQLETRNYDPTRIEIGTGAAWNPIQGTLPGLGKRTYPANYRSRGVAFRAD